MEPLGEVGTWLNAETATCDGHRRKGGLRGAGENLYMVKYPEGENKKLLEKIRVQGGTGGCQCHSTWG